MTLYLTLKAKYYDMIESGEKPEEYRDKNRIGLKGFLVILVGIKIDTLLNLTVGHINQKISLIYALPVAVTFIHASRK